MCAMMMLPRLLNVVALVMDAYTGAVTVEYSRL